MASLRRFNIDIDPGAAILPVILSNREFHYRRSIAAGTALLILVGGFLLRCIFVFAGQMSRCSDWHKRRTDEDAKWNRELEEELYEKRAGICKAFANPVRLKILDLVAQRARPVSELHRRLGIF